MNKYQLALVLALAISYLGTSAAMPANIRGILHLRRHIKLMPARVLKVVGDFEGVSNLA